MQIVIGILITTAGVLLLAKTEWFLNNFGRMGWFEEKLGSAGGSRLGYKLVGFIFVLVGIIVATGSGYEFMSWILAPLLKYGGPQ